MKLLKYMMIMILLVVSAISVSAVEYDVNTTIRIDSLYTEGGILTQADANITITTPSDTIAVSNVGMNQSSTGVFYYDYLIPNEVGTYDVVVRFYTNNTLSGIKSDSFVVGEETLAFGTCPAGDNIKYLYLILIILFIMFFMELLFGIPYLAFISSIFIIFTSLYLFACSFMLGMIILVLGMIMTIYSVTKKI